MSNNDKIDSFANRLKEAMRIRGITAVELSEKADLSKASISQYTNGVYEAKQNALFKLAKALDVSEAWLMGFDTPMNKPDPLSFDGSQYTIYVDDEMYQRIENYRLERKLETQSEAVVELVTAGFDVLFRKYEEQKNELVNVLNLAKIKYETYDENKVSSESDRQTILSAMKTFTDVMDLFLKKEDKNNPKQSDG